MRTFSSSLKILNEKLSFERIRKVAFWWTLLQNALDKNSVVVSLTFHVFALCSFQSRFQWGSNCKEVGRNSLQTWQKRYMHCNSPLWYINVYALSSQIAGNPHHFTLFVGAEPEEPYQGLIHKSSFHILSKLFTH